MHKGILKRYRISKSLLGSYKGLYSHVSMRMLVSLLTGGAATATCKIRIISVSDPRANQTILVRFPGPKAFVITPRVLLIKKERKRETHNTIRIAVFVTSPPRGSFA